MTTSMTRAIGYIRVSDRKQVEHGLSLEAQEAKLRAYAELFDLELVSIERDEAVTAKPVRRGRLTRVSWQEAVRHRRPALGRALDALDAGEADALLVLKLDRLTRSLVDLGEMLDRYFQRCALMSVSEQINTQTAAGRLVLNVLMTVAQWEREAIGERTAAVLSYKRERGEKLGGHAPYGWIADKPPGDWKLAGEAPPRLVEDPAEQARIEMICRLRRGGLSLRKIADELNRAGIPARGSRWHHTSVARILKA